MKQWEAWPDVCGTWRSFATFTHTIFIVIVSQIVMNMATLMTRLWRNIVMSVVWALPLWKYPSEDHLFRTFDIYVMSQCVVLAAERNLPGCDHCKRYIYSKHTSLSFWSVQCLSCTSLLLSRLDSMTFRQSEDFQLQCVIYNEIFGESPARRVDSVDSRG